MGHRFAAWHAPPFILLTLIKKTRRKAGFEAVQASCRIRFSFLLSLFGFLVRFQHIVETMHQNSNDIIKIGINPFKNPLSVIHNFVLHCGKAH